MDQYRKQGSNRVNQGTLAISGQKQSFWAKLYKRFMNMLSFLNQRGRQLLWIGSTGFIILLWPFMYLSMVESGDKLMGSPEMMM